MSMCVPGGDEVMPGFSFDGATQAVGTDTGSGSDNDGPADHAARDIDNAAALFE